MLFFQAVILGVIQGLTEFIPISSSAHLIIVPWLFGWNDPTLESLPFDVALHLGTLISVLWFFSAEWIRLIRAGVQSIIERRIGDDPDRRLAWFILIGCVPGAIAGVLGESKIEELFHAPNAPVEPRAMVLMALIIAFLGLALYVAERIAKHVRDLRHISLRDAVAIGLAQGLAIFPGVSRSGATITAGLGLGLERESAARFSFLLSAPIIAGAGLKSLVNVLQAMRTPGAPSFDWTLALAGFVAAAVTGYLAIKFLLAYLQRNSTDLFVYYRWALAVLIVIVARTRG